MLGFIGGIFELLKTFGYLAVCFFIKRNYYSSILSKLYHIESKQNLSDDGRKANNEEILYGINQRKSSLNEGDKKIRKIVPKASSNESWVRFNSKKNIITLNPKTPATLKALEL